MRKKLLIYRRNDLGQLELLRTIAVAETFIGIGKNGNINNEEFKKLALDLEPDSTSCDIIDL